MRLICFIFLLYGSFGIAQVSKKDSIALKISTCKIDSQRVKLLNNLSWECRTSNPDTAYIIGRSALELAQKIKFVGGEANALHQMGVFERLLGNYPSSINYYKQALEKWNSLHDKKNYAKSLGNLANVYSNQGDRAKALQTYYEALKIDEELGNEKEVGRVLLALGNIFSETKNYNKALEFSMKALDILEKTKALDLVSTAYCNIGIIYDETKEYKKAIGFYFKAQTVDSAINSVANLGRDYGNIGNVYRDMKDYRKALQYHKLALEYKRKLNEKRGIAFWLGGLGQDYADIHDFKTAIDLIKQGTDLARSIGALELVLYDEQRFYQIYEFESHYKEALEHYKNYIRIRDSLFNEENTKKMVKSEMNFEFQKKEAASKLEQEKKEAVSAAESKKQKIIIWSVSGILLLVIGFAFYAYRSYLQKQKANIEIVKQKHIIEEKQKEIIDSIRYAKRIQTALLTSEKYIDRTLNNLFSSQ